MQNFRVGIKCLKDVVNFNEINMKHLLKAACFFHYFVCFFVALSVSGLPQVDKI